MNQSIATMAFSKPVYIRQWLTAAMTATITGLALAVPAQADDDARGYAYQLHQAKTSVEQLGQAVSQYEPTGGPRHVIQGPAVTLEWLARIPAAERAPENAIYPLYRKSMGLLVPHYWADGRPASQDSGWHSRDYAIYYDSFVTAFKRGDDDRRIDGHQAEHYIFTAQHVSWAEGDSRKEHSDVTYNLWVLPDFLFSWATLHALRPDKRVAVAMVEHLADLGLVARMDRKHTRFVTLPDDKKTPVQHFANVAWISDIKPATPPTIDLPIVEAESVNKLEASFRKDRGTFCKTVLGGDTPSAVTELLDAEAQDAFINALRPGCAKRYGS